LRVIGQRALAAKSELKKGLGAVLKQKVLLRADGVVLLREGNRVYLAGSTDESHYFAVAEFLRVWGVGGSRHAHSANSFPKTHNSPLVILKSLIQRRRCEK
jgi:hypothetical protein